MVRFLSWDDVDSSTEEEFERRLKNYSDEHARAIGYANAEVLYLEHELGKIAGAWRTSKDPALVAQYRDKLYEMIEKGYDYNMLLPQDQLPVDLMPELPPADKAKSE